MLAAGSDVSSVGKRYQQQRDERGFSTRSLREMTKGVESRGRLLERTCVSRISWDLNYTRDAVRASPLAFVPTQGPETVQLEANHKAALVCVRPCTFFLYLRFKLPSATCTGMISHSPFRWHHDYACVHMQGFI